MNYKKLAELAQEAITLQEVHKDYMNGHAIKEHDIAYIRERLHSIEEEIISLTWKKEKFKVSGTLIDLGSIDSHGNMFSKDCKINISQNFKGHFTGEQFKESTQENTHSISFGQRFTDIEVNKESKEITKCKLHSVSLVRKQ